MSPKHRVRGPTYPYSVLGVLILVSVFNFVDRRRISRTAASLVCLFWLDISTRSLGSQTPECVSSIRRVRSPNPADRLHPLGFQRRSLARIEP